MIESLIDAAMSAVLDPGAHVKRGEDADGKAYGEPLNSWQRRALRAALPPILRAARRTKAIADATEAIDYFYENPEAWSYVRATNPDLVARLRIALGEVTP